MNANSHSCHILVIEDEASIRDTLRFLLESEGYSVVTAENGQEGLNELERRKPDLILLDLMMPVMDGRRFLEMLRSKTEAAIAGLPVMLLSAACGLDELERKYACKALQKPCELDELLRLVSEACAPGGEAILA